MFDLLFTVLLQAAAGDPAPQQPAQTTQAQAESVQTAEEQARERRRCRARNVTGTRLQSLVTCRRRDGVQDQDTREALHDLQRPAPVQGN